MGRNLGSVVGQALGGLAAIMLAVFCPQPGSASVLVPIGQAAVGDAARWASKERAQLLAFDPAGARMTVIAPSTLSLVRALGYGFVPIAAEFPPCGASGSDSDSKNGTQE